MKELSIEEKAKAYDEAIVKLRGMMPNWERLSYNGKTFLQDLIHLFPELKESEDEQHSKWILEYLYDGLRKSDEQFKGQFKAAIAWLEKQGGTFTKKDVDDAYLKGISDAKKELEKQDSITKLNEEEQNRFAKGVLTSCAMSFIDYLDAHKYEGKMCVSNGECVDIENAFHNAMWDRLHRYYCKYIGTLNHLIKQLKKLK